MEKRDKEVGRHAPPRKTNPRPSSKAREPKALGPRTPRLRDKLNRLDWSELEFFLTLAEAGSLRSDNKKTGHSINTIRTRLARIEDKLGTAVLTRTERGLKLTTTGKHVVKIAREMRLVRDKLQGGTAPGQGRERIRLAATEGLGTYWLMPRLVEFQDLHPELEITLHCDMKLSDVASGESDIAVQLEKPADGAAYVTRIGTRHLMPFAADSYLRAAGTPRSVDEWPNHRLVWQEADQVASHLLPFILGSSDREEMIGIRTNSSSAHFRAIASGGGIGILPTYARAISRRVRPLDVGVHLRREILCVTNGARASSPGVQLTADWLAESFAGDPYPWFRDEFIHPRDFEETISSKNVISLFEGFIDAMDADDGV